MAAEVRSMIFTYQLNVFLICLRFVLLAGVCCGKEKTGETRRSEILLFFTSPFIAHLAHTSCTLSLHIYGYVHRCIL